MSSNVIKFPQKTEPPMDEAAFAKALLKLFPFMHDPADHFDFDFLETHMVCPLCKGEQLVRKPGGAA